MSQDRAPVTAAELEDLDLGAMGAYLARRVPSLARELPPEAAAARLGLVSKQGSRVVPTAAGLLAFGSFPQLAHPEWGVGAVRVRGLTLADEVAAREDVEGDLSRLLEQSLAFIERHSRMIEGEVSDALESEYPSAAVREALVNALVHRDLRRSGRVLVRLFDDRLEVWSPGGPPEGLTDLSDIVDEGGVSLPRNPLLASVARGLGLGEQLGRGLPAMRRAFAPHKLEIRSSPREVLAVLPSRLCSPNVPLS